MPQPPPPFNFGHPPKIGFLDVSDYFKQKKKIKFFWAWLVFWATKNTGVGFGYEPNSTLTLRGGTRFAVALDVLTLRCGTGFAVVLDLRVWS